MVIWFNSSCWGGQWGRWREDEEDEEEEMEGASTRKKLQLQIGLFCVSRIN